jgi:hypothetical protein
MKQFKVWFTLALGFLFLATAALTQPTAANPLANNTGLIAYAGLDNQGRAVSLKTMQPNGSQVQTLYTLGPVGEISEVAWSPNAQEIAFVANDEAAYSIFNHDVFGIKPNGTGIRRISNPPRYVYEGAPTGLVTAVIRNNSGRDNVNIISLYIQGGTSAHQIPIFNHLDALQFTLEVADQGPSQAQYLVATWADGTGGPYKEFVLGFVDVIPGQTVDMGTIDFVGHTFQPKVSDLSWNAAGTQLGFLLTGDAPSMWQVAAAGEVAGQAMSNIPLASTLAQAPLTNRVAYYRVTGAEGVFAINNTGGSLDTEQIVAYDNLPNLNFDRHVAWLPDEAGLIMSVNGDLYEYIFATQQLRPLTNFAGTTHIDRLTLSPDGQTIAFGKSTVAGQSDIWLLNRQTLGQTQLTNDGRSALPSWSRVNPPTSYRTFLPLLTRP